MIDDHRCGVGELQGISGGSGTEPNIANDHIMRRLHSGQIARHGNATRWRALSGNRQIGIGDEQRRRQRDGAGNIKDHRAVVGAHGGPQGAGAGIGGGGDVVHRAHHAGVTGTHGTTARAARAGEGREIGIGLEYRQDRETDVGRLVIGHAQIPIRR